MNRQGDTSEIWMSGKPMCLREKKGAFILLEPGLKNPELKKQQHNFQFICNNCTS